MMVLTENNELYSWGQGIQGECGIGEVSLTKNYVYLFYQFLVCRF